MISKKLKRAVRLGLCGVMLAGFMTAGDIASAAVLTQQPSYKTVTETFDWGPSVSKVIVNLGSTVKSSELNTGMFKVHVRRELAEGAISPAEAMREKKDAFISLGAESTSNKDIEGDRQVTKAYVSDEKGNAVGSG